MWIWLCIVAASVILDQLTKLLTVATLGVGESVDVIPGVLRFTYIQNEGAAFGMLSDSRWVFMVISSVAILAMLVYLWKFRPDSIWACTAMSLVIGGGIGNMIDRVRLSYVIDMIDFCAFPKLWMWVFNVADSFVCVGAGMLIVWLIGSIIKEAREEKAKKANEQTEQTEQNGEENV